MKKLFAILLMTCFSIVTFPSNAAFMHMDENTKQSQRALNPYEKLMVGKVWITTKALDQNGKMVRQDNEQVATYFGLAEYYPNGTFKMTTLDGKPKMQGDWSFSKSGSTRTLVAKDAAGKVLFTRTVENVKVKSNEYIYRVYPKQNNKKEYFDIVHKVKR